MNDAVENALSSIETYLNPDLFRHEESFRTINQALVAGKLVVIRDAMREGLAERMFRCLDQFSEWKVYEGYHEHFHYHHHNIFEGNLFPPDMAWCNAIFASNPTKNLMQRLSQRDCSSLTVFAASWYLPGDHSLPHNDFVETSAGSYRQLAFIWHLTKDWQPTWGGDFFWCPASRYLAPAFNTLLLFTVGPESNHFVTHVSPHAGSKRLAINGWWTGKEPGVPPAEAGQRSPSTAQPLIEVI